MADRRSTILQIIPQLDIGGAERTTVEIAAAIVKAGGRSLVLSEGGRLAHAVADAGGELIFFAAATKNPAHMLWNALSISRLIARENIDLVHARSRAPAWSALLAARRTGRPFVTTYHGAYSERGAAKRFYNSVMARGDIVIANSRYTAALISSRYATPSERIRVIYRGVCGSEFDPGAVSPGRVAELRAQWGVAHDQPIILHAARLTSWKGQSVVIDAARLLKERGGLGNAVIVFAGDAQGRDGYAAELNRSIAAKGLQDCVRFAGHVGDMAAAFYTAHLAVVASTEPEAFGRAATEAQAMGCPVIATNIGAPPETVLTPPRVLEHEATGWLVPPKDAAALAQALAQGLALTPELRSAMGARARTHVLQSFSLETMQRQTLAVYDHLLGTRLAAGFSSNSS